VTVDDPNSKLNNKTGFIEQLLFCEDSHQFTVTVGFPGDLVSSTFTLPQLRYVPDTAQSSEPPSITH
jgi:hypothetical protein